jgi:ElaB/YqjD/DUF883 family membrane-anchored ribosome-binding protein
MSASFIAPSNHSTKVTRMQSPDVRTDQLMQDLAAVVNDTEELLKATAGDASERAGNVRARVEESLRTARARMTQAQQDVANRARAAAQATNEYVHENPWPSIGAAAGVGFVVGLLIGRR